MSAKTGQVPQQTALEYLSHLETLGAELETAMGAVGANELSRFEESVAVQQDLCRKLVRMAGSRTVAGNQGIRSATGQVDELLQARIRRASESLDKLNARYASLLKHSSSSIRLLAALCHSYSGHRQATTGRSWSCEL